MTILMVHGGKRTGIYNIKGTVSVKNGEIKTVETGIRNSFGEVKILGGIIGSESTTYTVYNEDGQVIIEDGVINGGTTIYNTAIGSITIKNGTIKSNYNAIYNNKTGKILIEGGTIETTGKGSNYECIGVVNYSSGEIIMTGGSIRATISESGIGIKNNGRGTVKIGKKDGNVDIDSISIYGQKYGVYNITGNSSGTLNFYDGKIEGNEGYSIYGAVTEIEGNVNLKLSKADDREIATLEKNGYIAQVGENKYEMLLEAIMACNEGSDKEISILKDCTITESDKFIIDENSDIKLNLNGNTITTFALTNAIENNGDFTLTDNVEEQGQIISRANGIVLNNGKLRIEKGTLIQKVDGSYYENFRSIITNNNELVVIGGDIQSDLYCIIGILNYADLTIDGGKISITGEHSLGINNKDNGNVTLVKGYITAKYIGIYNESKEKVIIKDGEIISSESRAIDNRNLGELNISGGTITATKNNAIYNINGNLIITGGTISSNEEDAIYNNSTIKKSNNSNIESIRITGGTIISTKNKAVCNNNSGEIRITGGTFTSEENVAIYNSSSGKLTLGENTGGIPSRTNPKINGATYGIYNSGSGEFNFYDGIISGGTKAIYGLVTKVPEDYDVVFLDDSETVAVVGIVANFENVILMDGTYYDSLQTAISIISNAESKTNTIHVTNNLVLSQGIVIPEGVNITLALEGHILAYDGEGATIINNGTLNIVDYADVEECDESTVSIVQNSIGAVIQNNGILTIGQTSNPNENSPRIIGNPAVTGNVFTKNSGTIEDTGEISSTLYGFMTVKSIEAINKIYLAGQSVQAFLSQNRLSTSPEMKETPTEWTNENSVVTVDAYVIPVLNLYVEDYVATSSYTVNYLEKGTNTVLHEVKEVDDVDCGEIINVADEKINITGYKFDSSNVSSLTIDANASNNVMNLYYVKDKFNYTVEYYYNEVKDESKTDTINATYQDKITTYTDKNITGYKLDKTENLPLIVSENVETNIIKVYYIIDPDNTKTLSYTVEYYKEGIKVEADTQTESKAVQVLQPDTLEVDVSKINISNKYIGYKLDKTEPAPIPSVVNNGDVIKVYYNLITLTLENSMENTVIANKVKEYDVESEQEGNGTIIEKKNFAVLTKEDDEVIYEIKYNVIIDNYIGDATVDIVDTLPFRIDEEKSDLADGVYNSIKNEVLWTENLTNINTYQNGRYTKDIVKTIKVVYNGQNVINDLINTAEGNVKVYYPEDGYQENGGMVQAEESATDTSILKQEYKADINIEKVWEDDDNQKGKRPESVTIEVKSIPNVYNEKYVLDESNHWKETIEKLDKYTDTGDRIIYTVTEEETNIRDLDYYNTVKIESTEIQTSEVTTYKYTVTNEYKLLNTNLNANIIMDGTEEITNSAQNVDYEIKFTAEIANYIGTGKVKIIDTLPYKIDVENSNLNGGTYDDETQTIIWEETIPYINTDELEESYMVDITKNILVLYKDIDLTQEKMTNTAKGKVELYDDDKKDEATTTYDTTINVQGKVTVRYVDKDFDKDIIYADEDENGNQVIKNYTSEITGKIGKLYTTLRRIIENYNYVESTNNENGQIKEEEQEVIYYYERVEATVLVKYIDEAGADLLDDKTITGKIWDEYTTEAEEIEGYRLKGIPENATGTMEALPITVTYIYEKIPAKVTVRYLDEEDNELSEEATIEGYVNTSYKTEAKIIDGYELKEKPANAEGIMTKDDIIVVYTYKKVENKPSDEPKEESQEQPKNEPKGDSKEETKQEEKNNDNKLEDTQDKSSENKDQPQATQNQEVKNTLKVYTGDEVNKVKYVVIVLVAGIYLICMGIVVVVFVRKNNKS